MIYDIAKRLMDIISSVLLAIIFLPIWIIVPLLQKVESTGPVFYTQERLGKNGKKFKLIKFRSMYVDADNFWHKDTPEREKARKSGWKMTLDEDPRITKFGKFLRQTSIDEFPQILNILLGDMSLVGPRPIRAIEKDDAINRYGKKIEILINESLSTKPGLTGPWQVSGRNEIPWNQRLAIDADYAKRKSIIYDIYIILKTPFAMISKW